MLNEKVQRFMYLHGWRFDKDGSTAARKEYFEKDGKRIEVCYPCNFVRVAKSSGLPLQGNIPLKIFLQFVDLFS